MSSLFTGGVTAVLMAWRDSTVDIALRFEPESDELYRALPELKERLAINIEIASPSDFIPEVPGWQERSLFIIREGKADFFHFDPYSQALVKIERGHDQDFPDARSMSDSGLIERTKLSKLFLAIEPNLHRYPAIKPSAFRKAVELIVSE